MRKSRGGELRLVALVLGPQEHAVPELVGGPIAPVPAGSPATYWPSSTEIRIQLAGDLELIGDRPGVDVDAVVEQAGRLGGLAAGGEPDGQSEGADE